MADTIPAQISAALAELRASHAAQGDAIKGLSRALQQPFKAPVKDLAYKPTSITEHRRAHRVSRPAKLDTDGELRAFVLARIDCTTYEQIAAEVAQTFPPERRVSKTAIHTWWRKNETAIRVSHCQTVGT